ncbi:aspartic peptidase domain-containing protein [Mycena crocata]|nr:aspartic peptidase domain-containing protein [Mycena crocata]
MLSFHPCSCAVLDGKCSTLVRRWTDPWYCLIRIRPESTPFGTFRGRKARFDHWQSNLNTPSQGLHGGTGFQGRSPHHSLNTPALVQGQGIRSIIQNTTMWCTRKLSSLLILSSVLLLQCRSVVLHGKRLSLQRRAVSASRMITSGSGTLDNVFNQRYVSNITVNGQTFKVLIDTGSSDLWIRPSPGLTFENTGISVSDRYGDGTTTSVNGTIGFASVELGGYTSDRQAFNNATSVGLGLVLDLQLDGLIGLGFDGNRASPIAAAILSNDMDPNLGKPFLFNIFEQTPQNDNFIGISLSRTDDLEGSADASFTINEIDSANGDVVQSPELPLVPGTNGRWSIAIDGISVDGVDLTLPKSAVAGSPDGKIVALMDTGTPTGLLPADVLAALYAAIPGSGQSTTLTGAGGSTFTVPCDTTSIVRINIGGKFFAVHPLDLSDAVVDPTTGELVCITPLGSAAANTEFDTIFGDTFLRNIYTVYNFGDSISQSPTGNATMQLLSQTDPAKAAVDVVKVRMARLNQQSSQVVGATDLAASGGNAATPTDSDVELQLKKYAPIVIGLLGGNLLVVLILVAIGLVVCIKRGGKDVRRSRAQKYAPVGFTEDE